MQDKAAFVICDLGALHFEVSCYSTTVHTSTRMDYQCVEVPADPLHELLRTLSKSRHILTGVGASVHGKKKSWSCRLISNARLISFGQCSIARSNQSMDKAMPAQALLRHTKMENTG